MNGNALATIVAFYLSKYNKKAIENLGFPTFDDAFKNISKSLGVKKNYVKLSRDEFDPLFPWREGWKRPMAKRIIRTVEILDNLEENDLKEIVADILYNPSFRNSESINEIVNIINNTEKGRVETGKYIIRNPTGRLAEEYFQSQFKQGEIPIKGDLFDCRDLGCGYDYKIVGDKYEYYIEVKGLSDISGGVLFTNKEWKVANDKNDNYFLCLVRNTQNNPKLELIKNPASLLNPTKNIKTVLQISWSISDKNLKNLD